jgi:hypothetical protein
MPPAMCRWPATDGPLSTGSDAINRNCRITVDRSPPSASTTASARLATFFARPGWGVFSRSMAAIFGGYALAAVTCVFCALALPGARGQTVLTGMLVAIVVCACAALWAFASRTALRAWLGIALPTLVMAAVARALGAWA